MVGYDCTISIQTGSGGPIAIVTLNRPELRKALSLKLMLDLIAALDDIGCNQTENLRRVCIRLAEPPRVYLSVRISCLAAYGIG
jgi:enoyl-CoA hydratase/carnithine racemase